MVSKYFIINLTIIVTLGLLAYGSALYFSTSSPPSSRIIVQPDAPILALKAQEKAPSFAFTTPDGEQHKSADFHGKAILLNFWASWCPPCLKEFPRLLRAAAAYPDDLVLIALSSDLEEEAMVKFMAKLDLKGRRNVFIALDQDQKITQNLFETFKLPETLIIDRGMVAQHKIIGADWDYEMLDAYIQKAVSSH